MQVRKEGNYHDYYKRRGVADTDHRLQVLKRNWLENKVCFDVGCNEGRLTLVIAKMFKVLSMVGIDVDRHLVDTANSALKRERIAQPNSKITQHLHFKPRALSSTQSQSITKSSCTSAADDTNKGQIDKSKQYPYNVMFIAKDIFDMSESERFDTILCLSLTKWIHLNHGDEGIRKLFTKLYNLLKPEGVLILEYQTWRSYKNRRSTTDITAAHFDTIQFRPETFADCLISDYDFELIERLGPNDEDARGFDRPIIVLRKIGSGTSVRSSKEEGQQLDNSNCVSIHIDSIIEEETVIAKKRRLNM